MFNKSKGWISGSAGGGVFKPKNPHSLEHLKYLYGILCKNQTVTDQNLSLLVETLRSISEILIWGDQNDSSVFDFFLEKNMLVFFLKFMRQKSAQCICVQLLQTLNILFDNITNKTSIYYLLSNNHINSIIIHKFDFSDEEVMAYYISFLKTLSMKLNKHTIHFFYNEHTNDFALYTEAIKFFNHPESMVRIAVRTITLNVYRACVPLSKMDETSEHCFEGKSMIQYIKERTAVPYFSNLVKFIGQHVVELNTTMRQDNDHNSKGKLADLVAEHLDHLHYLNDILCLDIDELNETLTEHLLDSLFVPLYMDSLLRQQSENQSHVDQVISLFLLSQVFLIIHHPPLVKELVAIIMRDIEEESKNASRTEVVEHHEADRYAKVLTGIDPPPSPTKPLDDINSTDEEKLMRSCSGVAISSLMQTSDDMHDKPYMSTMLIALDCSKDDYRTLLALCLQYALNNNKGIDLNPLEMLDSQSKTEESGFAFNSILVRHLIRIMSLACQNGSKVRLATLELSVLLLKSLVMGSDGRYVVEDEHLAAIEGVREEATLLLRSFYKVWQKSEEIFLDMFEDEHRELKMRPLNVEHLVMDASIVLPPISTPLTGVDFAKRLPCGEVERARKAIRSFFILRDLSFTFRQEVENDLPLTKESECVKVNDVLDLNNSDLIACTIVHAENKKERRFLVIDVLQLILVEPESKRLGWGIVKFVGFLQDTEVMGDKDDSRSLLVTIHRPSSSSSSSNSLTRPFPILSSKFIFDDHIRCMAARQRLTKGRLKARQRKMQMIARMLDMPSNLVDSIYVGPSSQEIGGRLGRDCVMLRPSSASSHAFLPGQAQRRRGVVMRDGEGRTQMTSKKNSIPMTYLDSSSHPSRESSVNCNTSRASTSSSSSSSIKQSIFASVDQVPAFTVVASEQEYEKRSRKLKAKLTETIARHQSIRSSSFSPDAFVLPASASPTSEVKKKMFLSMAKEAKQRQQCSKYSSEQSEGATHMELVQLSRSQPSRQHEAEDAHGSCHEGSSGSNPSTGGLAQDLDGRSRSPRVVSKLRSRANSESGGKNLEVKGRDCSEKRRFSGSLSKNVFTSLLSPLVQRSPREGQKIDEPKDDSFLANACEHRVVHYFKMLAPVRSCLASLDPSVVRRFQHVDCTNGTCLNHQREFLSAVLAISSWLLVLSWKILPVVKVMTTI